MQGDSSRIIAAALSEKAERIGSVIVGEKNLMASEDVLDMEDTEERKENND